MNEAKLSTGVAGLDDILEGGIDKGLNILLKGGPGAGKTTMGLQFLVEGARVGQRGMYLTFEEGKDQIIKYGRNFFAEIDSLISDDMIQLLDFSMHSHPHQKMHTIDGTQFEIPEKDLVNSMAYIEERILEIRGQNIQRVVIDGVQTFSNTFSDISGKQDNEEVRRILSRILVLLKREGISTYLLSEESESQEQKYWFMNFAVDGVLVLKVNEALDMRTIRVAKMRGTRHPLSPSTIILQPGQGVLLSQRPKTSI